MITGDNRIRNKTGELLYGNLTERIIGFCFEIHNEYKSGHKESVYQNLLEEKFNLNNISYRREFSISIKSQESGLVVGSHRLDFVVDEKVVIELKAIKFTP